MTYRDAGVGPDDYPITVSDCLSALSKAISMNWYNFKSFSAQNFTRNLKLGDLSWIVPGKIIAFPSPVSSGYGRSSNSN
jgi:cell division cycle 14